MTRQELQQQVDILRDALSALYSTHVGQQTNGAENLRARKAAQEKAREALKITYLEYPKDYNLPG